MKKQKEKKEKKHTMIFILIMLISLIVLILLWSRYISTQGIVINEYAISNDNLPANFDGLKIVHFSDLHYGSTIFKDELKKIVQQINKQNPDIIVFTGDLVENGVKLSEKDIQDITSILQELKPTIKTYAVKGNHDYESNYWDICMPLLSWQVLDNTFDYVYYNGSTPIVFVGLDDLLKGEPDYDQAFSFKNEHPEDLYTIVLLHEPDQIEHIKNYAFNIALGGHSHLGQVRLPFVGALYTPVGSKKYYDAHYKIGDADLFINNGLGTSVLPFRFFNKPSITLFRFYTH